MRRSTILARAAAGALVASCIAPATLAMATTSELAPVAAVVPLENEVEQVHNPPPAGGHMYSLNTSFSTWEVVAIRSKTANDTLTLYDTADRSEQLARSAAGGSKIDFVAAYSYGVNPVYPVVTRKSGDGKYTIEASSYGELANGSAFPYQTTSSDVVRAFDTYLTGGTTVTLSVDPAARLNVSLFLVQAVGSNYQPRAFAVAEAHSGAAGVEETIEFAVPATGEYAVVVLFDKGSGSYTISRQDS